MTRGSRRVRASVVAAGALSLLALTGGSANAASNHAISGTVYSPCSSAGWVWYNSQTARYKAGYGAIKAQFSDINPGGLNFRLLDASNAQIGITQQWGPNETGIWRTFSSSVPDGKRFYNSFKELDGKCGYGNYSFTGTEYY